MKERLQEEKKTLQIENNELKEQNHEIDRQYKAELEVNNEKQL